MSSEKMLTQNFVFTVLFGHYLDPPIHFHFHPTLGLDPALILTLRPMQTGWVQTGQHQEIRWDQMHPDFILSHVCQ